MSLEIERKFLVKNKYLKKDISIIEKIIQDCYHDKIFLKNKGLIKQIYLSTNPEFRLRSFNQNGNLSYFITMKGFGSLAREEREINIGSAYYNLLYNNLMNDNTDFQYSNIEKDYAEYDLPNGLNLELSMVDDSFIYFEIEFPTIDEAKKWKIPAELQCIIEREITYEPEYKMKNYWLKHHKEKINNVVTSSVFIDKDKSLIN